MVPSPFVHGCTSRNLVLVSIHLGESIYLPPEVALRFAADLEKEAKRLMGDPPNDPLFASVR